MPPQWCRFFMQALQYLPERLPDTRHMIIDALLSAEPAGYFSGTAQFIARHIGEEMMHSLVVQAAVKEVDEGCRAHVAGCKDLLAQEIQRVVICIYYQHTLVVGRKD